MGGSVKSLTEALLSMKSF